MTMSCAIFRIGPWAAQYSRFEQTGEFRCSCRVLMSSIGWTNLPLVLFDKFSQSSDRLEDLAVEVLVIDLEVEFPLQVDREGNNRHRVEFGQASKQLGGRIKRMSAVLNPQGFHEDDLQSVDSVLAEIHRVSSCSRRNLYKHFFG